MQSHKILHSVQKVIYPYFLFFLAKEIVFDCADESVNTAECNNEKCYCTGKADKPCTTFSSGIVNKGNGNTENLNSSILSLFILFQNLQTIFVQILDVHCKFLCFYLAQIKCKDGKITDKNNFDGEKKIEAFKALGNKTCTSGVKFCEQEIVKSTEEGKEDQSKFLE